MRILINGAETAIGAAVAKKFAGMARQSGVQAKFALVSRQVVSADLVEALKAEGADSLCLSGGDDTSLPAKVTQEAISFCGGLDLVASTSLFVSSGGPLEISLDDWDNSIDRTIRENMLFAQAAREALAQSQGSIIFLCSTAATLPVLGLGAATPAMAGLHMLTRSLADEWSGDRIRVNAVALGLKPGPLDSQPSVADVAGMFGFLAREGSYMTGQILAVDAGSGQRSEPAFAKFEMLEAARCA